MSTTVITKEVLSALGASEWKKDAFHRFYFNDLPSLYGLSITRYSKGSIKSARLDGETISNKAAWKLTMGLTGKFWFDIKDGKFHGRDLSDACFQRLVSIVKEKAQAMSAPAKKDKKAIMARAWEMARQAVKTFGGKVRDYFSASLKLAWAGA